MDIERSARTLPDDTESVSGRRSGLVLLTDVGSTTTKGLLLQRSDSGGYRVVAMEDVPTTVELPEEDVCIGVSEVVRRLEEATGEHISRSGMPSIPYLSTSSAGGGLQMLVFGLTSSETGRIAENTAFGAGGIVLRTITIDDELSAVEKMIHIQELHPDMILMAGGTDGGDIAGVVRLAELLMLSNPVPKYREGRIPLVYCGNARARSFVSDVLENQFELHMVENVRPSMETLNTSPARDEVHRLFMDSVMERAPGYSRLKEFTVSDILPTPAAVDRLLGLYASRTGGNLLMVDIGGATTDIFTRLGGNSSRTVAANTGMSYSISNILAEVGIDSFMELLPPSFHRDSVRSYIYNKTLAPTYVPTTAGERLVEHAAAIAGTREAWKDHLRVLEMTGKLGRLDCRKKKNRKEFDDAFGEEAEKPITIGGDMTVIGAGGVISHADPMCALRILTESFLLPGVTRVCIDRHFRSPHAGILSTIDDRAALDLFESSFLEDVGFVVAPDSGFDEGRPSIEVRDNSSGNSWKVSWGEVLLLAKGGELKISALRSSAMCGRSVERLTTELPVLVDCRGRGTEFNGRPLELPRSPDVVASRLTSSLIPSRGEVETGPWEMEYRLPYEGDILIGKGEKVKPGTLLGENRFEPPRLFILDLNRIPGYERHLSPKEVLEGLKVSTGDTIELNQALYAVHRGGLTGFDFTFRSPVRGLLTRIEQTGLLVLREIQDYDGDPHVVDVAGPMGIPPRHIRGHLKFRTGDFVGAGQTLASDLSKQVFVHAPSSGVVKSVDTRAGTVTIQYDIRPVRMLSTVMGEISRVVPDRSVTVSGTGARLRGVIGFGRSASGELTDTSAGLSKGTVVYTGEPLDLDFLRSASESGIAGLVAPSIAPSDWVEFRGCETSVSLTGDEDIPFTLLLTSGFGKFQMDEECMDFLNTSRGKIAGLSGRTQIRAGVIRPTLIICD